MSLITYKLLDQYKEIAHFCTTREGGVSVGNFTSNNMSPFCGDNPTHVALNQSKLSESLDIGPEQLIIPYQTHGTEIREIDADFLLLPFDERNHYLHGVDALYTRHSGLCIGVTTADCVPVLFFDPYKQVIAVAHAGWRGTCLHIAEKTISTLVEKYECKPEDILVTIGPSISPEVYEVGKEVLDQFNLAGFDMEDILTENGNTSFLDLWKANQQSLMRVGILKEHIEIAGICTYTQHERFFSARRLGIKSGRLLSGIMLK